MSWRWTFYGTLDELDRRTFEDVVIMFIGEQMIAAGLPAVRSAIEALKYASVPLVTFDRAALKRIISNLEQAQ